MAAAQALPQQYQYIKLPDGSYSKFAANATDDEIKRHIQHDFPSAFAPQQHVTPTPGASIGAAPPRSVWERARDTVANSAIGHSLEEGLPKVADALDLHPTETVNSPSYQSDKQQLIAPQYLMQDAPADAPEWTRHMARVEHGALTGTGQLTSGKNLATVAGIAATGGMAAPLAEGTGMAAAAGRAGAQALKYGMTGIGAKGVYDAGKEAVDRYRGGDTAGAEEAAGEGVPNALMTLPGMAEPMEATGEAMQRGGENLINRAVGARKAEFRRGANPGEGYFQSGFGPSMSMRSITNKAEGARESTGENIGAISEKHSQTGTRIPYEEGAAPIQQAIANTRAQLSGPGGTGDTSALDAFESTWEPLLQDAQRNGGFDPVKYAAAKRNTAKNTTWGDATQAGMKDMRQSTVGGMGGAMVKTIPELELPNRKFQNLTSLARVADDRATTGQRPLTEIGRKLLFGGLAAGSGLAAHDPFAPLLTGAAGLAIDSIPVRTATASGLFYGGKGLAKMGRGLDGLLPSLRTSGDDSIDNHVDEQGSQSPTDNQKSIHSGSPAPYRMSNLSPEIIRPDAMSRSRFGLGTSGKGGTMVRPLAGLPAPESQAPQATPYMFTPRPTMATPSRSMVSLTREVGPYASLVPSRLLNDVTSSGTEAEKSGALRRARTGLYGTIAPLPPRVFSEPEVIPPDRLSMRHDPLSPEKTDSLKPAVTGKKGTR